MQAKYTHSRTSVHLIFVTKYRRQIFTNEILTKLECMLSQRALKLDCEISEFNGESDHVHMILKYPPKLSLAKAIQDFKSFTGYHLPKHFPEIQQPFWKTQRLWSPSYFAASVGGAPIEVLKQYIEQQERPH